LYLKVKFGDEALAWLSAARGSRDEAQLTELCERIFSAGTAEEVRALLAPPASNATPQA
jgi:hypothetical protein